nr:hypothetical protein [Bacillus yapensis]
MALEIGILKRNDATFMRMKDDYMKNEQLKAGYNLQKQKKATTEN